MEVDAEDRHALEVVVAAVEIRADAVVRVVEDAGKRRVGEPASDGEDALGAGDVGGDLLGGLGGAGGRRQQDAETGAERGQAAVGELEGGEAQCGSPAGRSDRRSGTT